MTETPPERYRRLAADLTATLAAVPADRWDDPSPCPDWTARGLVRHLVETPGMIFGMAGRTLEPGPSVDEDPVAAYVAVRDQVQAALDDPEVAGLAFDGFFGRTTLGEAVDRFLSFDTAVHRCDVGRATGVDVRLDPADVEDLWTRAEAFGPALRAEGVCGPAVVPPADADPQTRLLAHLGRRG
ncbi:MAG: TIGR03086 family metal-binding protein [Actinomycetota bacterium]|nr:TIGR03086 family metal-binding protein [Actinomycetota bacterium]